MNLAALKLKIKIIEWHFWRLNGITCRWEIENYSYNEKSWANTKFTTFLQPIILRVLTSQDNQIVQNLGRDRHFLGEMEPKHWIIRERCNGLAHYLRIH